MKVKSKYAVVHYPIIPKSVEINVLEDRSGNAIAYFLEGFWNKRSFATTCNKKFPTSKREKVVTVQKTTHCYLKRIKHQNSRFGDYIEVSNREDLEAFKATCVWF